MARVRLKRLEMCHDLSECAVIVEWQIILCYKAQI